LVKITYIEANGRHHVVEAVPGPSVMETAKRNAVPGIAADCGGACACATCRVYIDEAWQAKTGTSNEEEGGMIEFSEDKNPSVRLSCQIKVTEDLDGLVVRMPASQHRPD
jgi:ferredoxin, 2Fe-2S